MHKIVLMGYMASGKTSVGRALSQQMSLPHIDLDAKIEEKIQMDVPSIFKHKGEIYFRKIERETLVEILSDPAPLVLSLGGGTPCYANNHELFDVDDVVAIYLKASIETLADRLAKDNQERPLIDSENKAELKDFIAKHLFDRSYYYNTAKHTVAVNSKTVEQIAKEIIEVLT